VFVLRRAGLTRAPCALQVSDWLAWKRLWADYLEFYESPGTISTADTTFERLLDDDPKDFSCIVAELDGRLVGFAHYLFHRHNWHINNVCYLQDLFAEPNVRGRGIGRALIEAVYAKADLNQSSGVYWMTQQSNLSAQQLYDRIATKTDFIKYQRPAA